MPAGKSKTIPTLAPTFKAGASPIVSGSSSRSTTRAAIATSWSFGDLAGAEDGELVTADAGKLVGRAYDRREAPRDHAQGRVPSQVPEPLVHVPEVVDVDVQQSGPVPRVDPSVEGEEEAPAVAQTREQVLELGLEQPLFGGVMRDHERGEDEGPVDRRPLVRRERAEVVAPHDSRQADCERSPLVGIGKEDTDRRPAASAAARVASGRSSSSV